MDIGHDWPHYTTLYPFKDRPDVAIQVLWYWADPSAPVIGFPTPFVLRNWDRLDQLEEPEFGTRYDPKYYYSGPLPTNQTGIPCGTPEQWLGEIDYDTYIAGGYSCNCPIPNMPTVVTTWSCDDSSLSFNQPTGDVVARLNLQHRNLWAVGQMIAAGSPADCPLEVMSYVGQSADVLRGSDEFGVARFRVRPGEESSSSFVLALAAADATVLLTLSAESLRAELPGGSGFFQWTVSTTTVLSAQQLLFAPTEFQSVFVSRLAVGQSIPANWTGVLSAQLELLADPSVSAIPARVLTTLGEASSAVAEVYPDGSAWFGGYFQIGGEPGTQLAQLSVSTTDTDKPSVLIQGAASQYGPLLQILDALGAVDFRVEADGNIASSKIEFVGGTLGNVIARLPISSPGAGVIGYIPIYDDIE